MHLQALRFLLFVRFKFPHFFTAVRALDVGSGDINGNLRSLFNAATTYHGNDVVEGPNVTIVSKTSALTFPANYFDIAVSSECFEHDPEFKLSLQNILRMLRPGGLLAFTCASTGRPEHGTQRTTPGDSLATLAGVSEWVNYYHNLTHWDVAGALSLPGDFAAYQVYFNAATCDMYFVGILKGGNDNYNKDRESYQSFFNKQLYAAPETSMVMMMSAPTLNKEKRPPLVYARAVQQRYYTIPRGNLCFISTLMTLILLSVAVGMLIVGHVALSAK